MIQIIYASAASESMVASDLPLILEKARVKNERLNITGFLLYDEGSFLQVLEGPNDALEEVLGAIIADNRHKKIRLLSKKIVDGREFGDWAMAYAVKDVERARCDGFLDYAASREEFSIEGGEVTQILSMFQEGLLRQADHSDGFSTKFNV
ncbi:BLUF domain-containing protein [Magnetospirillum molischianum]|uniref:Putative Photopigment and puc expression activator n=1 Tax=Magnetospirillum molischianum DSM 120 TaxID=1150626 RepID=H8FX83_MAGML|nr:BLUF domain-containing protein [Magnetospirillum molischianum]CCG42971.1 putative Photopigment and puc expression activator [Magnetospirillum molischianum DSM 120]